MVYILIFNVLARASQFRLTEKLKVNYGAQSGALISRCRWNSDVSKGYGVVFVWCDSEDQVDYNIILKDLRWLVIYIRLFCCGQWRVVEQLWCWKRGVEILDGVFTFHGTGFVWGGTRVHLSRATLGCETISAFLIDTLSPFPTRGGHIQHQ